MNKNMKRAAFVGTAAVATMGVGIAYAAWTSTGTGSGTAKSTTSVNSTIAPGASAADLYPGATKSITVTVDNPNDYPVIVTSLSSGTSDLVGACAAGSVSSDGKTLATGVVQTDGTTVKIAPGGSGTYTLVTKMIANPTDACKSQTFTLPLTAALESAA